MSFVYQIRRDLATNWFDKNPVLADGEQGYEIDTGIMKVGNGVTPWNSLINVEKIINKTVQQVYTPSEYTGFYAMYDSVLQGQPLSEYWRTPYNKFGDWAFTFIPFSAGAAYNDKAFVFWPMASQIGTQSNFAGGEPYSLSGAFTSSNPLVTSAPPFTWTTTVKKYTQRDPYTSSLPAFSGTQSSLNGDLNTYLILASYVDYTAVIDVVVRRSTDGALFKFLVTVDYYDNTSDGSPRVNNTLPSAFDKYTTTLPSKLKTPGTSGQIRGRYALIDVVQYYGEPKYWTGA